MAHTPDSIRAQLGKVAKAREATGQADANIKRSAEERTAEINRRLVELHAPALTDKASTDEYMDLIAERGRLAHVLGL